MTMPMNSAPPFSAIVIGGGPAGLMAAERLILGGATVDLFDAMPSVGRKFLLAGKGGMNLTHAEPFDTFLTRYGTRQPEVSALLQRFDPQALRAWVHELGIDTFIGSSQRVFPADMKAAPLLRAWLHRLREAGVKFHMRTRWLGWHDTSDKTRMLRFAAADGERLAQADVTILALGGASWARLGSDGAWVPTLQQQGVSVAALQPANCGFDVGWSEHFASRFAGHPVKSVCVNFVDACGRIITKQGEFVVSATGVEGSAIYALSSGLRDRISSHGSATLHIDLAPGKELQRLRSEIAHPRGSRSFGSHMQSKVGISGVKAGLLRELVSKEDFLDSQRLAENIKALPLTLHAPRPIDEAISTAGGVMFESLDEHLMIRTMPGVFCAGEMLDWEAPTGGYLLTACLASGRQAGNSAIAWMQAMTNTRVQPSN